MEYTEYVIIVAGGKGTRMGSEVPKQFLTIDGQPILMRSIRCFKNYNCNMKIILVLPKEQQEYWKTLCEEYSFNEEVTIADGGETRFHSVKNGLDCIPDDACGTVCVHDGVRPFVSGGTIHRTCTEAQKSGAAVPVIPVVETLRHLYRTDAPESLYKIDSIAALEISRELRSETVPRDEYRIVQTPQTFRIDLLKKAYRQEYCREFTDDASVVEHDGQNVALVEGNEENIKITTPFDLAVGEAIVKQEPSYNL